MDTVSIRKTNSLIILSALSIVLLTITLSIMLSSNHHFLPNSSAQAQTFANNTDSVIIPNNIRLNFSELFTRVESSVLQVTDPSAPGLLGPRLGSGFVYDKEGHIITNNHVVAGGSGDLDITFLDGTVYEARLIGSDPYSDLAVLKVEEDVPRDKLVPLPLGNSSTLKIGQPVAAVGNPFGLSGSITEGIISGLGRSLPSSVPQDPTIPQLDVPSLPAPPAFSIPDIIQTDAAINPGNSGGPLLNVEGQVIGMNTAIFSATGAYAGIGFAIPSNTITKVVPSLIATGSYQHPWLGMIGVDITPDIAKALGLGLGDAKGFLVIGINEGSPADKAGIRGGDKVTNIDGREIRLGGDIVLKIDNQEVRKIEDILTYLERHKHVGDTTQLTVLRDGKPQIINITLTARPGSSQQKPEPQVEEEQRPSLGISGTNVTFAIAKAMTLTEATGFLVVDIIAEGPADKAGIRGGYVIANINGTEIELGGDVILRIDNRTVNTIDDILSYLDTKKVGDIVQLTILRDGKAERISVQLGPSSAAAGSIESPNNNSNRQQQPRLHSPESLLNDLNNRCARILGESLCDQLFGK